jgi:hypothetical protein
VFVLTTTFGIKWKWWDLNIYLKLNWDWFSNKERLTSKQFSKIIPSHLKPVLNVSAAKAFGDPTATLKICYWTVLFLALHDVYFVNKTETFYTLFDSAEAGFWEQCGRFIEVRLYQKLQSKGKIAEKLRLHAKLTSFVLFNSCNFPLFIYLVAFQARLEIRILIVTICNGLLKRSSDL